MTNNRYFLPLAIKTYDAAQADEVKAIKNKLNEDELVEQHKDDPRLKQHLEASRPKITFVEESTFVSNLNALFAKDTPASELPEDAMSAFLQSGAIVLTESEAKKLKLKVNSKGIDI